jgi:hypothetical protein
VCILLRIALDIGCQIHQLIQLFHREIQRTHTMSHYSSYQYGVPDGHVCLTLLILQEEQSEYKSFLFLASETKCGKIKCWNVWSFDEVDKENEVYQ